MWHQQRSRYVVERVGKVRNRQRVIDVSEMVSVSIERNSNQHTGE